MSFFKPRRIQQNHIAEDLLEQRSLEIKPRLEWLEKAKKLNEFIKDYDIQQQINKEQQDLLQLLKVMQKQYGLSFIDIFAKIDTELLRNSLLEARDKQKTRMDQGKDDEIMDLVDEDQLLKANIKTDPITHRNYEVPLRMTKKEQQKSINPDILSAKLEKAFRHKTGVQVGEDIRQAQIEGAQQQVKHQFKEDVKATDQRVQQAHRATIINKLKNAFRGKRAIKQAEEEEKQRIREELKAASEIPLPDESEEEEKDPLIKKKEIQKKKYEEKAALVKAKNAQIAQEIKERKRQTGSKIKHQRLAESLLLAKNQQKILEEQKKTERNIRRKEEIDKEIQEEKEKNRKIQEEINEIVQKKKQKKVSDVEEEKVQPAGESQLQSEPTSETESAQEEEYGEKEEEKEQLIEQHEKGKLLPKKESYEWYSHFVLKPDKSSKEQEVMQKILDPEGLEQKLIAERKFKGQQKDARESNDEIIHSIISQINESLKNEKGYKQIFYNIDDPYKTVIGIAVNHLTKLPWPTVKGFINELKLLKQTGKQFDTLSDTLSYKLYQVYRLQYQIENKEYIPKAYLGEKYPPQLIDVKKLSTWTLSRPEALIKMDHIYEKIEAIKPKKK